MPHLEVPVDAVDAIRRPLSISLDGQLPFTIAHEIAVPYVGGVYVISDLRGPLYVGLSGSLRRRYLQHLQRSHNDLVNLALDHPVGRPAFAWIVADAAQQSTLERRLVRYLRPLCNYIRFNA